MFTTSADAQANGKSDIVFKQGVTSQDINNTTSYEGDAISVGLSAGKIKDKPQATMSGLGYGTDSDSDSSITKGGVSGYNDPEGILTTENREALAGKLENVFDASRVTEELGAQTQITQAFDQERRKIKTEINKKEQDLRAEAERQGQLGNTTARDNLVDQADKVQNQGLLFDAISGAIYGPNSNGVTGYAAKAASPYVANQIGTYFKANEAINSIDGGTRSEQGSAAHLLAHTLLGAAVSYATGNDSLTGGLSAGVGEASAPLLSKYLYGTDKPSDLTAEQKDTVSAITSIVGATIGATTGNASDAANAAETNKVAVEDNGLQDIEMMFPNENFRDPNFAREDLELIKRLPEMVGSLNLVYKKNDKGHFIICVPYSGNSCTPRSNERYATQQEVKQGAQDFALDVVPLPGGKGVAVVLKKTGQIVGKYKDARAAKKAADEAVAEAKVGNNFDRDNDFISYQRNKEAYDNGLIKKAENISTANSNKNPPQVTNPRNISERILWRHVEQNPKDGQPLVGMNNDPRFPKSSGFQKMQAIARGSDGHNIVIHYQYNSKTNKAYDIKIVSKEKVVK